ncbi:MAG: alpha/beta fold hydrolase [Chloroflexi bacterium]|nr:alpha/beta fold hydrolase [Chloroflexota bacterium]
MTSHPVVKRGGITAVILILFVFLPAFTLAPVAPEWAPLPLRNWAYDMRLMIGRPITTLSSLAQAFKGETAVTFHTAGEQVEFESDGLMLVGTLYGAEDAKEIKPGILLVHGSTPQGRKLGMYRVMGERLAALGYVVLTIDQRGFGQSDNPPDVNDANSFDFATDVDNSLVYLAALPIVDAEEVYLIGHSFGGDVSMTAVQNKTLIDKMVIIGPGRRYFERGGTPEQAEFEYFKRRQMRYMFLWQSIPDDVFKAYRTVLPVENHLDYFAQPDHVPTLLIDGELESAEDQAFLADVFDGMAGEKAYVTLDEADHYANVANLGSLIFFDETAVNQLITEIDTFFVSSQN